MGCWASANERTKDGSFPFSAPLYNHNGLAGGVQEDAVSFARYLPGWPDCGLQDLSFWERNVL